MINRKLANIIVPLTKKATNSIFRYEFDDSDFALFALGKDEVYCIIDSPISKIINKHVDIGLDIFEEEECVDDIHKLKLMKKELEEIENQLNGVIKHYNLIIISLLNIAITKETGVFFYF